MKIQLAPTVSLLLLVQLLIAMPKVEGDYDVSVSIISYNNSGKICLFCLSGGAQGCCDGSLCGYCDHIFHYCLREFGSTSTSDNCHSSEIEFNSNSLILSPPNPVVLQGISTHWTGVQLLIKVTRGSDFNTHGNLVTSDRFHINIAGTTQLDTRVTGTYQGLQHVSIIKLSYELSCINGPNCLDRCSSVDCGAGTCVPNSMSYRCDCDPGFSGSACEIALCSNYCMNGGTCVLNGSLHECHCHRRYTGTRCEMIDYCADAECSRNGKCQVTGKGYTCECNPGFTGTNCDRVDLCVTHPLNCGPDRRCESAIDSVLCVCNDGFIGTTCKNMDYCFGIDGNSGECINGLDSFLFQCKTGFTGINCELTDHCHGLDCSNGTCLNITGNFSCECMGAGKLCEAYIYECEDISCNSEVSDGRLVLVAKIVGGVGGGLVVAVLLLLLMLVMIVVRTFRSSRKNKSSDQGKQDNPICTLVNESERTCNSLSSNVHLGQNQVGNEDRLFLNPIYGGTEHEVPIGLSQAATTSTFEVPRSGGIPCSVKPATAPASYEVPRSGGIPCSVKPTTAPASYEVPRSGGMPWSVKPTTAPASYEVPRSGGMPRSPDRKVRAHGPFPLPYEKPISRTVPHRENRDPTKRKKLPPLPTSAQLWKKPPVPLAPKTESPV